MKKLIAVLTMSMFAATGAFAASHMKAGDDKKADAKMEKKADAKMEKKADKMDKKMRKPFIFPSPLFKMHLTITIRLAGL